MTRAKFKCVSITELEGKHFNIVFSPVIDNNPENKIFWEATPNGRLEIGWVSKEVAKQFIPGEEYFLDIIPTIPQDYRDSIKETLS